MANIITKVFGSSHDREIKRLKPVVIEINEIYETLHDLSDEDLKNKTLEFRTKIDEAVKSVRDQIEQFRSEFQKIHYGFESSLKAYEYIKIV